MLQDDYAALAAEYFLPGPAADFTATELGRDGASADAFHRCSVRVQALPGRSKLKTAGTGVTDLDRLDAYAAVSRLLEQAGFYPWSEALRLVETETAPLAGLGADWQVAFPSPAKRKKPSSLSLQEQKKKDAADRKRKKLLYADWQARAQAGLAQYYSGQYHLLIAYQNGLVEDAKLAREILKKALGARALKVHLEELPSGVHLSNWDPSERQYQGRAARPQERADRRQAAWQPWVSRLQKKYDPDRKNPLDGTLVIARKHYKHADGSSGADDPINKQVGRIELINGMNVLVQYLLPSTEGGRTATEDEVAEFRLRTINAWGDLAWKPVGRMHGLKERLAKSLPHLAAGDFSPIVLGMGIIRVNQKQQKGNNTSFIPYLVEIDTQTGECLAATLLQKREHSQTEEVIWLPLSQAVRRIASHGSSYLGNTGNYFALMEGRKNQSGQFFFNQLRARAAHHSTRDVVILADMSTLGGVWPWLADKALDGSNAATISLPGGGSGLLKGLPHVSLLRIRPAHAPKVVLAADGLLAKEGEEARPVGTWADAKLYHLSENAPFLPTYLSFGSKLMSEPRAQSCYRPVTSLKGKDSKVFNRGVFTGTWATPVAVEITVVPNPDQSTPRYTPDELARFVEDLRASYDHFGGWTTLPGPLHFASVLKQYVPDYELAEFEADDEGGEEADDEELE